jgi:aryl-alcohol dehydrogenase-like predicted oxidoreductase
MPRPVISQVIYNVLIRQIEIEYLRFAERYSIHTTTYNALAGGLLTGRYQPGQSVVAGTRFEGNAMYLKRYWTDRMLELAQAIAGVGKDEGMTPAELAYAWLAHRPGVGSVLLGPGTVEHLDVGISGCGKELSAGAIDRIDELCIAFAGTDARYAR